MSSNASASRPDFPGYTGLSTTYCAGPLWSAEVTWGGADAGPDFTPCFHKTVLVYAPCAVLWVLAPLEHHLNLVAGRTPGAAGPIGRTWQNRSRAAVTVLLMLGEGEKEKESMSMIIDSD